MEAVQRTEHIWRLLKNYQTLVLYAAAAAAAATVDPALSLRYAQSLFSERVALNVTHGKHVFNASPL